MGKVTKWAVKKATGKYVGETSAKLSTKIYNLSDDNKKRISIGLDVLGMLNGTLNTFFGAGEISDVVTTAPLNAYWINSAYHDKTMATIGALEELGPFVTDVIPSNYIAHRRYIKRKQDILTTRKE